MMTLAAYLVEAEKVIDSIKKKFSFGYYDEDDIAQEARIYAMETFPSYDQTSPPQPFIRVCLTNKLNNLYRKKCRRSDSPCKACHAGVGCLDGDFCRVYEVWADSQNVRYSLMNAADISEAAEEPAGRPDPAAESELAALIDAHLPADLRGDYLKMVGGVSIPPHRKLAVRAAVLSILTEFAPCLLPADL